MSIDVLSHIQTHPNAVKIILTDNTVIEVIAQPEGSTEDLHVNVKSDHKVKIDFTVREK